jgi:hypothetical protein
MRRVKLPELLIEVDNELSFTRHFLTPAQRQEPSPEDICAVLAAVMAHGCNLGAYTMAQLTLDVSYEQLKRIADWQLTEEAQRGALAQLVGAITGLDTSSHWGEGKTAASDGQRFSLPRQVLQQTYSTRFSDFALEFYTFVADNYAPFYSLPVESRLYLIRTLVLCSRYFSLPSLAACFGQYFQRLNCESVSSSSFRSVRTS